MRTLQAFRPFLHILKVFNGANFKGKHINGKVLGRNLLQAIAILLVFLLILLAVFFNLLACLKQTDNLVQQSHRISALVCLAQQWLVFLSMMVLNRQLSDAIEHLQDTVQKRVIMNRIGRSQSSYPKTEQRYSLVNLVGNVAAWPIIIVYMLAWWQPISYAIFNYPEPDQWFLPHGYRSPFPGNIYVTFGIDWLIQTIGSACYMFAIFTSVVYYLGMCWYIHTMVDDLRAAVSDLNEITRIETSDPFLAWKTRQAFSNAIVFHCQIIKLANRTAECMSPALFFQLLFSAIEMALYCFVVESNVFFSFPSFVANVGSTSVLLPTFFYCNLSEAVSADLSAIGDVFYNYSWYSMRANQRKHILFPIRRAQQEFRIQGFGIVQCSLGAFMSIMQTAFSYFVLIRSFK